MFMIDLGVLSFLSILMLEITDKYGPGGIRDLLRGRYNNPRNENRIFLFLDINESTTIAERIGHEKYFNMLKDFFADITDPILENSGHIYQYVGDEVILSWKNNTENKLRCLKFVKDAYSTIKRKEKYYNDRYGFAPTFKAGIHAGDVTAGYIGIIKKELVFSGDTLNTTARIRSKCHELNSAFVLSNEFLEGMQNYNGYNIKEIGEMELKGRREKEKLYALNFG
jgi:adenylate cyclase